ncbi:MAG: rhomboid family intramembrane serine protease [Polyangiaceae bacterium]
MEKLLARIERRFGNLAIAHLTTLIVGGMAVVFVLASIRPEFKELLTLDLGRVRSGQVWRLVTYLFLPESDSLIWILLSFYWLWLVGTNLENEWGPFKFNVYYLFGMVGTTVAAWLTGGAVGNFWLNTSLYLAFATVFPDFELFLFFIVRIKVKWLGILLALVLVYEAVTGSWVTRSAIIAAMANYLFFFTGDLVHLFRARKLEVKQAVRRQQNSSRPPPPIVTGSRVCAICGAREADGADIRVCSCEKCGGKTRDLCLAHARNH